ncbi:MAG: IS1 family transposase [Planctomycetes bacterium]|nr:IS1 family transposase [Planctomycetota bacterium]
MAFVPPFCPRPMCSQHREPEPGFCIHYGFYQPKCRDQPLQRFRCRFCRSTFSIQAFRLDYHDRRPEVNVRALQLLTSGVGFRQTARTVEMGNSALQYKARKFAQHAGALHDNLSAKLPEGRTYVLDEEETYEKASIRTLTMPIVIERENWFVVATAVGSTRRLAAEGTDRRAWQDAEEAASGPRSDESRACVAEVLKQLDRRLGGASLGLLTDEKSSYGTLSREVFGDRVDHQTTSSRVARGTFNPLFPINTTLAMTRDNLGRLRRQSWLVTKERRCLRLHMNLFIVYRNYIRFRFNRDKEGDSPAVRLRLVSRNLTFPAALGWRQDWGQLSIHPLSLDGSRRVSAPA